MVISYITEVRSKMYIIYIIIIVYLLNDNTIIYINMEALKLNIIL